MPLMASNIHSTIGEFQRNYIYKLFIETVPVYVQAKFPQASPFQGNVDLYNTKAIFPDRKTSKIKIEWGGEFFNIPGTDESTRETDLEFYEDEPMWVRDFFEACKDITGNEINQASVYSTQAKFNIGIAQISVDKETIRAYRRLVGVRVYETDVGDISKDGKDVNKLRINISWDRSEEDRDKRGQKV